MKRFLNRLPVKSFCRKKLFVPPILRVFYHIFGQKSRKKGQKSTFFGHPLFLHVVGRDPDVAFPACLPSTPIGGQLSNRAEILSRID